MPRVACRDRDKFGPGTGAINADAQCVRAKVAAAGKTISAMPASDMAFPDDEIALRKPTHICSNRRDLADEFVADGHRHRNCLLRPIIPVVNVNISAAD
jgi:hypothetical protein